MPVSSSATVIYTGALSSGQTVSVSSGQAISSAQIVSGGVVNVASGGQALDITVNSSGAITLGPGAILSSGTTLAGAVLVLSSGSEADNLGIAAGASISASSGAVLSNTSLFYSSGGAGSGSNALTIGKGVSAIGVSAVNTTLTVSNGGFASGVTLSNAGIKIFGRVVDLSAISQGSGYTVDVDGGGTLGASGGSLSAAHIQAGGKITVYGGGVVSGSFISSGGVEFVLGYTNTSFNLHGSSVGDTILAGGVLSLWSSMGTGYAFSTIVSSGGMISGNAGRITSATISAGGSAYLSTTGMSATGDTILGTEILTAGATATSETIGPGGILSVGSASTASGNTVSSGGNVFVASNGATQGGVILSGGSETVAAGGSVTSMTVSSGGSLQLSSGVTASGLTISSGATVIVATGNTLTGTTVLGSNFTGSQTDGAFYVASAVSAVGLIVSGTTANVLAGGYASNVTLTDAGMTILGQVVGLSAANQPNYYSVNVDSGTLTSAQIGSGAGLEVYDNGVVSLTVISSGGVEYLIGDSNHSGTHGSSVNDTVLAGGVLSLYGGHGVALSTTVSSGGTISGSNGGVLSATILAGGGVSLSTSNASASYDTILGVETLLGGASATSESVGAGGLLSVGSGSLVSGATISSGGYLLAAAGGGTQGDMVLAGGSEMLANATASNITLSSGATLTLIGSNASFTSASPFSSATIVLSFGASAASCYTGAALVVANSGILGGGTLQSGTSATVLSGGEIVSESVASGARLLLSSGAVVNGLTISNSVIVSNGQTIGTPGVTALSGVVLSNTALIGSAQTDQHETSALNVSSGVSAVTVTVSNTALSVLSGGFASNVSIESGGATIKGVVIGLSVASEGPDFNILTDNYAVYVDDGIVSAAQIGANAGILVYNNGVVSSALISSGGTEILIGYQNDSSGTHGSSVNDTVLSGGVLSMWNHKGGGSAISTTISSGGMISGDGGDVTSAMILAGGSAFLSTTALSASFDTVLGVETLVAGATETSGTVSAGGVLNISSASVASATTVSSGGAVIVSSGASLLAGTIASGGSATILSSGIASDVVIGHDGKLTVSSGGTAIGTILDSGVFISSNYNPTDYPIMTIEAGGAASGTVVRYGATELVSGISTSATIGGDSLYYVYASSSTSTGAFFVYDWQTIYSGGVSSDAHVLSDGIIRAFSGGTIINPTVGAYAQVYLNGGAVESGGTLNAGALQTNTGTASGLTINGGLEILQDAQALALANIVASSGYLTVEQGLASGTIVSAGGTLQILGGSALSAIVSSGGSVIVSGGSTESDTVLAGGTVSLLGGASASSETVSSGGLLNIESGATVSDSIISSGGSLFVASGAAAHGLTISSGANITIAAGNTLTDTTLLGGGADPQAGGTLYVESSVSAIGLALSGTTANIMAGGYASAVTLDDAVMIVQGHVDGLSAAGPSAAYAVTVDGGTLTAAQVGVGGAVTVQNDGRVSSATVSSGGTISGNGGSVISATILAGGSAFLSTGNASASFDTILGVETLVAGAAASSETVSTGGVLSVGDGSITSATTVSSGGSVIALSGGATQGDIVLAGGSETLSNATATDIVLDSGATLTLIGAGAAFSSAAALSGVTLILSDGASASAGIADGSIIVSSGGILASGTLQSGTSATALSDGHVISTTIASSTTLVLSSGSDAAHLVIDNGGTVIAAAPPQLRAFLVRARAVSAEEASSTGTTLDDVTISSGGLLLVSSGAVSSDVTILSGGTERVAGGTADTVSVDDGGLLDISENGSAINVTLSSGGVIEVASGATLQDMLFEGGGTIVLDSEAWDAAAVVTYDSSTNSISTTENSHTYVFDLTGDYTGEAFTVSKSTDDFVQIRVAKSDDGVPCFCAGTLIRTPEGERPVETLAAGDRVVTATGKARRIIWIGRRTYSGSFAARNPGVQPIIFRKDSLGDNIPYRDLKVSPLHAMYLEGCLVPAGLLANGDAIVRASGLSLIDYFHIELATHDLVIANGTPCETFIDDGSRSMFQNAATYPAGSRTGRPITVQYCAPRLEDGSELEHLRCALYRRHVPQTSIPLSGSTTGELPALEGRLDTVTHSHATGWAWNGSTTPVAIGLFHGETLLCTAVANRWRHDLAQQGVGAGYHGFVATFSPSLPPDTPLSLHARRIPDGAELDASPWLLEPASRFTTGLQNLLSRTVEHAQTHETRRKIINFLYEKIDFLQTADTRETSGARSFDFQRQQARRTGSPIPSTAQRLLVILPDWSAWNGENGQPSLQPHLRLLRKNGWTITITVAGHACPATAAEMDSDGFTVCTAPLMPSVETVLTHHQNMIDAVLVCGSNLTLRYSAMIREFMKAALLVCLADCPESPEDPVRRQQIVESVDVTLCHSARITNALHKHDPDRTVLRLPVLPSPLPPLFSGHSHASRILLLSSKNAELRDAIMDYFHSSIAPAVLQATPEIVFSADYQPSDSPLAALMLPGADRTVLPVVANMVQDRIPVICSGESADIFKDFLPGCDFLPARSPQTLSALIAEICAPSASGEAFSSSLSAWNRTNVQNAENIWREVFSSLTSPDLHPAYDRAI